MKKQSPEITLDSPDDLNNKIQKTFNFPYTSLEYIFRFILIEKSTDSRSFNPTTRGRNTHH